MTLFEFLSVAISIVLALSAGQLLTSLREVFDPARRSWIHATWVVHLLVIHVLIWWSLWAFRELDWNLATFVLILLPPVLLFVGSSALVPSYSQNVESWEEHFFAVRRWFFSVRTLFLVAAGFRSWLLLDKPVLESPSAVSPFMLVVCLAGLFIADRRVQGLVAVVAMVLLAGVAVVRTDAGAP